MTIKKGYVDTSQGQIHYHWLGPKDGLPIIYLHQTASSGKMFYTTMEGLDYAGPQVALDTPGFGGSYDPEGMPDIPDYADWLLEAIEQLGFDKMHLVGHHTGACIAVDIAARFPEKLVSFTLMGPVCLTAEERAEFKTHFHKAMSPTKNGSYLMDIWTYLESLGADSDLELHHREMADALRAYWGKFQIYSAVWAQDFGALLEETTTPLLLLCAPDDVLYPFFDRAKEIRPDAISVVTKGSNFEPDQDTPAVIAALASLLKSLEAKAA